jgi:hypothetical protein
MVGITGNYMVTILVDMEMDEKASSASTRMGSLDQGELWKY